MIHDIKTNKYAKIEDKCRNHCKPRLQLVTDVAGLD